MLSRYLRRQTDWSCCCGQSPSAHQPRRHPQPHGLPARIGDGREAVRARHPPQISRHISRPSHTRSGRTTQPRTCPRPPSQRGRTQAGASRFRRTPRHLTAHAPQSETGVSLPGAQLAATARRPVSAPGPAPRSVAPPSPSSSSRTCDGTFRARSGAAWESPRRSRGGAALARRPASAPRRVERVSLAAGGAAHLNLRQTSRERTSERSEGCDGHVRGAGASRASRWSARDSLSTRLRRSVPDLAPCSGREGAGANAKRNALCVSGKRPD